LAALLNQTKTIAILFVGAADPVGQGFVASLAHPGGNATGFTNFEVGIAGKWLELLKEIEPRLARVALAHLAAELAEPLLLDPVPARPATRTSSSDSNRV
jgi:ABC-type uncharacterized transport system substrate-binding protein